MASRLWLIIWSCLLLTKVRVESTYLLRHSSKYSRFSGMIVLGDACRSSAWNGAIAGRVLPRPSKHSSPPGSIGYTKEQYRGSALHGSRYVPPELDPTYRDVVVRPRGSYEFNQSDATSADQFKSYPAPKEGDIVLFDSKWGDKALGRIRFLRYVEAYSGYYADVAPLERTAKLNPEGGGDVFAVDRQARACFVNVEDLLPVKSYAVRKENGVRVYFNKNQQQEREQEQRKSGSEEGSRSSAAWPDLNNVVLKAPRYRQVDASYLPRTKEINFMQLESDLRDYQQLKTRILGMTLRLGAAGAVAAALLTRDVDLTGTYVLGVLSGMVYVFLLGQDVDGIGEAYSALRSRPNGTPPTTTATSSAIIGAAGSVATDDNALGGTLSANGGAASALEPLPASQRLWRTAARGRLLVPVLLLGVLAAKHALLDPVGSDVLAGAGTGAGAAPVEAFRLVPRGVYTSAVTGFLTQKLSILWTEVSPELRAEDALGLLPGSLAIGLRRLLLLPTAVGAADDDEVDPESVALPQRVVFLTGPAAAGRAQLVERVLQLPELQQAFVRGTEGNRTRADAWKGTWRKEAGREATNGGVFRVGRLLTTDPSYEQRPVDQWYQFISPEELRCLRAAGQLLFEGEDTDSRGNRIQVALPRSVLRRQELVKAEAAGLLQRGPEETRLQVQRQDQAMLDHRSSKDSSSRVSSTAAQRQEEEGADDDEGGRGELRVKEWQRKGRKALRQELQRPSDLLLLMGPPPVLDLLASMRSVVASNVWVSLQTKEQFIAQATAMVKAQLLEEQSRSNEDKSYTALDPVQGTASSGAVEAASSWAQGTARASADKVSSLVNEAARDINFYMQKAPLFDYTVLNCPGPPSPSPAEAPATPATPGAELGAHGSTPPITQQEQQSMEELKQVLLSLRR